MKLVSLVGLGKLGLSLAGCIADSGIRVIGVDISQHVVDLVNRKVPPMSEPGLAELLGRTVGKTLEATTDINRAVDETDVTLILVQTPSMADGRYGTGALRSVLGPLCARLRETGKTKHLISVNSTIQPGTIDNELIPMIEQALGRPVGNGIEVCYNPELVALGTTIKNFKQPDFVLIGASSSQAAAEIEAIQKQMTENDPPFYVMSPVSAEMVKIMLNTYLTVKISFANLVSQVAATFPGAELDKITQAIGADSRIGGKFIMAGNSFGGTCFPRDVKAFLRLLEDTGQLTGMAHAVEDINVRQTDFLIETTQSELQRAATDRVAILGLSFKPNTPVVAESSAIKLAATLAKSGVKVTVWDDLALDQAEAVLGPNVSYAKSAADAVAAADVVVLHNPVRSYIEAVATASDGVSVVDCWRVLDPSRLPSGARHVRFGEFVSKDDLKDSVRKLA
jgi:UDPglucose 6-dehydrogenase